jgi:hypothetical protein
MFLNLPEGRAEYFLLIHSAIDKLKAPAYAEALGI